MIMLVNDWHLSLWPPQDYTQSGELPLGGDNQKLTPHIGISHQAVVVSKFFMER